MGLSGESKKENVSTYQLLLEIARDLNTLAKDPKELEKTINESYKLTDAEDAKAQEALKNIEKNQKLVAQNNAILTDTKDQVESLKRLQKESDETLGEISRIQAELNKRDNALKSERQEFSILQSKLEADRAALKEAQDDLDKQRQEFKEQTKEFDAYKASLEAKAEQLRSITEGL